MTREQYRDFLKQNGVTQRERIVHKAIHDTNTMGPINPSCKDVTIDGEPRRLIVISANVTDRKTIHALPGEDFSVGSIIVMGGSHWLITERDFDDEVTVSGRIQICQKEIVWQDEDDLRICSLWATVEKPYYSNLSENNNIGFSTREFRIQMPFDEYSSRLNVGKRLMLEIINGEPKTYRITSVDQMTGRVDYKDEQIGFLSFNVEQDLYNPETDNPEKMICNYIPVEEDPPAPEEPMLPIEPPPPPPAKLKIAFNGEPAVRAGGFGKAFTASLDGTDEEIVADWILTGNHVPDGIHLKPSGEATTAQKCMVVAEDNVDLIGLTVELKASYGDSEAVISLEVI